MGYFITLIAKYYYPDSIDIEELSRIVKDRILEFNLEFYQEYKYHNKIMSVCAEIFSSDVKAEFKEREYIPIYEEEIELIETLKNDRQKKLMFTLFAIARYMECEGWINKKTSKDISEVFKLANITLTSDKRCELLHELYTDGLIFFSKKVDNLNIRVDLAQDGEIAYKLTDFKNIGNQYIGNFKKGYKQCKVCGTTFKINPAAKKIQHYCKKCAEIVDREKSIIRRKASYAEQKLLRN